MHIYKALEFARDNGERITSSNFTQSETPGKWDHKKHVVKNWNSENLVIGGGELSSLYIYLYIYIYTDKASQSWIGGLGGGVSI